MDAVCAADGGLDRAMIPASSHGLRRRSGVAGRSARVHVLAVFGALCITGCERAAPDHDGAEVVATIQRLEEQLRHGMVASDTTVLASLWAPEYLSTSAVGHTSSRAEALAAYGSGLVNVDSAVVRELDVRSYGDAAVSVGMLEWAGSAAAQPFRGTVRFLHVWVLSGGAWRLVASQLTGQPIRAPASSGR